jgi:hypothetical protein
LVESKFWLLCYPLETQGGEGLFQKACFPRLAPSALNFFKDSQVLKNAVAKQQRTDENGSVTSFTAAKEVEVSNEEETGTCEGDNRSWLDEEETTCDKNDSEDDG